MSDKDTSIFDDAQTGEPTGEPQAVVPAVDTGQPSVPNHADLLARITGEDGQPKYTTVETALSSLEHSQTHISKLEGEMSALRAQLAERTAAEEVLKTIESKLETPKTDPVPVGVDLDAVKQLVQSELTANERAVLARTNLTSVTDQLTQVFGEKAEQEFYTAAKDSGLSVEQMNELAATAPKAALRLVLKDRQESSLPGKITSDVNTQALEPKPHAEGTAKVGPYPSTTELVRAWNSLKPN